MSMRIISETTLRKFGEEHADAREALETWIKTVRKAEWSKSQDVLGTYPTADPVGDDRAVFNIRRNKYRIVVKIHYRRLIVWIRFIDTHAAYDEIDASTI
jgi:mRNA interferase HigB